MKPLCLLDMDGTLADFDGSMLSYLDRLKGPGEVEYLEVSEWDNDPPHIKARKGMIKLQPNWWLDIPKFKLGWEVYEMAKSIGFRFNVLTKGPYNNSDVWRQKFEWCRRHLGAEVPVSIVEDKTPVYGRVLVDDWPPYLEPWLANRPRATVIMPAQRWNKGFTHKQIIRYDGTNSAQVTDALQSQFNRK